MSKYPITYHFGRQAKNRAKLKRRAQPRFIDKAMNNGIRLQDINPSCKLYHYLDHKIGEGYHPIIYGRYIIVQSDEEDVSITLLHLPKEYYNAVDSIKRRKGGTANG